VRCIDLQFSVKDENVPDSRKGLPAGTPAPDFALTATDGQTIQLHDLRGQWVVVMFFRGTW
jgi:peroxiredoxin